MIAATARLCLSSALGSFLPPLSHSKAAVWDNLPVEKAIVPVPVLCYLLNGIYPHLSNFRPFLRPPVRLVSRPAGHRALLSSSQRPLHQHQGSGLLAGRGEWRGDPLQQHPGRGGRSSYRPGSRAGGNWTESQESSAAHCWVSSVREMLTAKKLVLLPRKQSAFSVQGTTFQILLKRYERPQRRERKATNTDGGASPDT